MVVVDLARPGDEPGIRDLLRRQPVPGRIRLAFLRDPDFSAGCAVTGDDYRIVIARSEIDGRIVGVACRSVRHVFLNGQVQRIGYLGQLRVDHDYRGRWLVSRGYSLLHQMDREDPLSYIAAIVEGNDEAAGVLVTRRRRLFPVFREITRYRTLALPVRWSRPALPGREEIVAGSIDQVPALLQYLSSEGRRRQLFSVWTEARLRMLDDLGLGLVDVRIARRDGAIVGVMALWDQSAYKQTVVHGYSGWLKALAPLSRIGAWRACPIVPRIGQEIRSAYASLVCIANDNASVFRRLLREIYNLACSRRFDYLLVGLDSRDPLLRAARAYRHFAYPSRLYFASWTNGGASHEQLDGRPVYIDIATL